MGERFENRCGSLYQQFRVNGNKFRSKLELLTHGGLRDTYKLRYFALTDSRSRQGTKGKYPAQSPYFFATSGIAVLGNEIHKGTLSLAAPVLRVQGATVNSKHSPRTHPAQVIEFIRG
jgi:hypothetical protein